MHNKFVVIDNQWVWLGSWNLTENGTYRNNNNVVLIASPGWRQLTLAVAEPEVIHLIEKANAILARSADTPWETLREAHVRDHRSRLGDGAANGPRYR